MFGTDDKVGITLLRESNLTLARTDEICRASETMHEQKKTICSDSDSINAVGSYKGSTYLSLDEETMGSRAVVRKANLQCASVGIVGGSMHSINDSCVQLLTRRATSESFCKKARILKVSRIMERWIQLTYQKT